ncbi:inosine triphosphate pyrophosphatase-like protein [Pelagophyceae sp. CCMP2097]|nr:inosine triphosphate pyrophosphatase-like protein [Pelagophyceae sp. CCMP2097]
MLSGDDLSPECVIIKFVTSNPKKLREVSAIMGEKGLPLPLQRIDIDLDECSESPEKIAAAKCRLAAEATGGPVLVDDTSLCLEALGGMPGPYIKWFSNKASQRDTLVRMLDGFENKRAYAQSCIAFSVGPGTVPLVFSGRVDGTIVEPRGDAGFGWDNVFRPDGAERTFAEMDAAEKNKISHRARALASLSAYLFAHREILTQLCLEHLAEPEPQEDRFTFVRRQEEL